MAPGGRAPRNLTDEDLVTMTTDEICHVAIDYNDVFGMHYSSGLVNAPETCPSASL